MVTDHNDNRLQPEEVFERYDESDLKELKEVEEFEELRWVDGVICNNTAY